jgi:hypothetical protein
MINVRLIKTFKKEKKRARRTLSTAHLPVCSQSFRSSCCCAAGAVQSDENLSKRETKKGKDKIWSFILVKTVHATFLIVVNKRQPVNPRYESLSIPFFILLPFIPAQPNSDFKKTQSPFPSVLYQTARHDIHPTSQVLSPLHLRCCCNILWSCLLTREFNKVAGSRLLQRQPHTTAERKRD